MAEIRIGAVAVASTAAISFLLPTPQAAQQIRLPHASRVDPNIPEGLLKLAVGRVIADELAGIEGIDFGELTHADVEMMRAAATTGALDIDFSDFYDEDE